MKIIGLSITGPTPDQNKMNELAVEEARNAWESDTPREAGGLMSWAASKAVGLWV